MLRLPSWDELKDVKEQLNVLEHPIDQPLFVIGPPGSGKTILAVHRAQVLSRAGKTTALVTFNRMLRRLAALLAETQIGEVTMHTFVGRDYLRRTGQSTTRLPGYSSIEFDWEQMLSILTGPSLRQRWDHPVIDEGQDLPSHFFGYLVNHAAVTLSVFADDDQAITHRTTVEEIQQATGLPDPFVLSENHRNVPEVARIVEFYHTGRLPVATVRRPSLSEKPKLLKVASLGDTVERIANWSNTRGGTIGVVVSSNSIGEAMHSALNDALPLARVDIYTSQKNNEDGINLAEDGVTILNVKSVKGQEFDALFIVELEEFLPCLNVEAKRRVMYMLCARARDNLFLATWCRLSPEARADLPPPDVLEIES